MTYFNYATYHFMCHVIGTISEIRIWVDPSTGYGIAFRDGRDWDIYNLNEFLMLAANRGCEIKCY